LGSFKNLLLQNYRANFNQTWHKSSLGVGISGYSNKGDSPSPRGDYERVKIHLKCSSPEPAGQFNQIGTNFPWMKGV
jgi:hypothetical protein